MRPQLPSLVTHQSGRSLAQTFASHAPGLVLKSKQQQRRSLLGLNPIPTLAKMQAVGDLADAISSSAVAAGDTLLPVKQLVA